jgi:hypothetical protein
VDDQVSLGLAKPKHFFGAVSGFHLGRANLAAICAPGRKVLLNYRDTPVQSAQLVGTDRTDAAGNWAVDVQSALKGQYQAVVKRRNVFVHGTRYICRSDHTPFMSF